MSDIGISCGSQTVFCDLPIRYDTYSGCTHDCAYCFARKKTDLNKIKGANSTEQLKRFIRGERTSETSWCDWDIPLHWGECQTLFSRQKQRQVQVWKHSRYLLTADTRSW